MGPLSYTPVQRSAVDRVLDTKITLPEDPGMRQIVCGGIGAAVAVVVGGVVGMLLFGVIL